MANLFDQNHDGPESTINRGRKRSVYAGRVCDLRYTRKGSTKVVHIRTRLVDLQPAGEASSDLGVRVLFKLIKNQGAEGPWEDDNKEGIKDMTWGPFTRMSKVQAGIDGDQGDVVLPVSKWGLHGGGTNNLIISIYEAS